MERQHFGVHIAAEIEKPLIYQPRFLAESIWDVEHWQKGRLLSRTRDHNICTDEGINNLLDVMFHGATQITTWYVLIFESDTVPEASTTYATPVFTESSAYNESDRPEYVEAAASAKSITNSANKATFTMNASKTIYGGALVGGGTTAGTKGDTAGGGVMYCASKFSSSKSVESGDVLKVTVTITGADA
ncbi:MAG: hypothetical protein JRI80_04895 [Deltaproteobacteria bacterium]|nr:hypothetical protein [Deltaproteobacteria bacterium]